MIYEDIDVNWGDEDIEDEMFISRLGIENKSKKSSILNCVANEGIINTNSDNISVTLPLNDYSPLNNYLLRISYPTSMSNDMIRKLNIEADMMRFEMISLLMERGRGW